MINYREDIMLSKPNRVVFFLIFIFVGCSNNVTKDNSGVGNSSNEPVTFTTNNVNIANVYINLPMNEEVSMDSMWHLSIQKDTNNYNMPSIIFDTQLEIALYDDNSFEDISVIPSDFSGMIVDNIESFGYNGINEVLSYDITVHQVSISNPNRIYILRFAGNTLVYKLQFLEYVNGITVFQYSELN